MAAMCSWSVMVRMAWLGAIVSYWDRGHAVTAIHVYLGLPFFTSVLSRTPKDMRTSQCTNF